MPPTAFSPLGRAQVLLCTLRSFKRLSSCGWAEAFADIGGRSKACNGAERVSLYSSLPSVNDIYEISLS